MKRILKLVSLPYPQKKLLIQTFYWVTVIRLGLWIIPFKRLNAWLPYSSSENIIEQENNWEIIRNVTRMVSRTSRFVPGASCLTQALAVQTLLGMRNQRSDLKIGVGKNKEDEFVAHAWIEIGERIVIGKLADLHSYSVMSRK